MIQKKAAAAHLRGDEGDGRDLEAGRAIEVSGDTRSQTKIQDAATPKADLRSQLRGLVRSAVIWTDGDYDRRAHARSILDGVISDISARYRIPRRELELSLADREVAIAEELRDLIDTDDLLRTIDSFEDDDD
jgi:hypothetical protein